MNSCCHSGRKEKKGIVFHKLPGLDCIKTLKKLPGWALEWVSLGVNLKFGPYCRKISTIPSVGIFC